MFLEIKIEVCYDEIEKSICRCTCGSYADVCRGGPGNSGLPLAALDDGNFEMWTRNRHHPR